MKILITGSGFENKGAEAMLRMVQVGLAKRLPSVELYLWRVSLPNHQIALSSGMKPLILPFESQNYKWSSFGKQIGKKIWMFHEIYQKRNLKNLLVLFDKKNRFTVACNNFISRTINGFDALIDISGYAYGNVPWATSAILKIQPLIKYCQQNNKPVFFMPQAWGSFDNHFVKQAISEFLTNKNVYFYSRDRQSSRYLESLLNETSGSIIPQPDIVFGFHGGTSEQGKNILRRMGCSMVRPIIGITPNGKVYERSTGKGTENEYLKSLTDLIHHCIEKHDVDIVLQANEIKEYGNTQDDRYLCSLVATAINQNERCFMTRDILTAEETISLVGQFQFIVSSRYHSLIFAFSQGIPSISISWSHKYRELFSLFNMEDSVLELNNNLQSDTLITAFDHSWSRRQQQQTNILNKIKEIQLQSNNLFDDIAEKILENE